VARWSDAGIGKRNFRSSAFPIHLGAQTGQAQLQGYSINSGLGKKAIRKSTNNGPECLASLDSVECESSNFRPPDLDSKSALSLHLVTYRS